MYKALRKASTSTGKMISHLRGVASKWMIDNADVEVWGGMAFRDLARSMANDSTMSFGDHVRLVGKYKDWVDASVLHALGCAFKVDVLIFQEKVDPTVVGFSLLGGGDAHNIVPLAMMNDRHFWSVRTTELVEPFSDPG